MRPNCWNIDDARLQRNDVRHGVLFSDEIGMDVS